MARTGLTELEAAIAVAKHRNFRAAAAELDVSPTTMSSMIRALEERIGVRIFNRSTRSVSPTAAGEAFLNRVASSVADIAEAIDVAQGHAGQPSGTLRINSSITAGHEVLSPLLFEYMRRYSAVTVELITDSRLVDIVLEGSDAGIRMTESVPADMVAVPLGFGLDFSVIASPAYLAEYGTPAAPADLLAHRCIRSRSASGGIYRWEFEHNGESIHIDVPGSIVLDDQSLILKAAVAGLGLGYISDAISRDAVAAGLLFYVLEDVRPRRSPLSLYYPRNRHTPAALRALVDLIRNPGRTSAVRI